MIEKQDSIIIIGAGAFGLSTALHLKNAGYENLTVLEKDNVIPSRWSAADDLNKIVRAEYEDPFYTDLAVKAIDAWKTPLFAPYFHQTGFLHCVTSAAPRKAVETLDRFRVAADRHPDIAGDVRVVSGKSDLVRYAWQLRDGCLSGWHGYLNQFDGYAHSANALAAIHKHLAGRGVNFLLGRDGTVESIVYERGASGAAEAPAAKKAIGVKTMSGRMHAAKLVIVAAGAAAAQVVPEVGKKVVAKSWAVAHIQLSDEETAWLRGIPVVYARDLGFFFEPDPATNLLKICPMGGGYINTGQDGVSLPPQSLQDGRFLPAEDESRIRTLLNQTLPSLADRALVKKTLCWFADTSDSDFIMDYIPGTASSVLLLSGDSGHGFKMFPIFGKWVVEMLCNPGAEQLTQRWRWKEPNLEGEDAASWGADVSWRLGKTREFCDIRISKSNM